VLLWKGKPQLQLQLLFAAQDSKGRYQLKRILSQRVDRLSVVFTAPPGRYGGESNRGTSVTIANDAIILETIEAGGIAYYMGRGKFRSVAVSE
jgi:hypothetical protein